MDTLFLLRSFGDFVIAMNGYRRLPPGRAVEVVSSGHLHELYMALSAVDRLPAVNFVDFGISNNILAAFTNRHLLSFDTWRELSNLRSYLKTIQTPGLFLEQKTRKGLLQLATGKSFNCVHNGGGNIYKSYTFFWGSENHVTPAPETVVDPQMVVIFPGSRKLSKQLPVQCVNNIRSEFEKNSKEVYIAGLAKEVKEYGSRAIVYNSFSELISVIGKAQHIVSADSLPAHLACYLSKSHEVYYHGSINAPWVTPTGVNKVVKNVV